jgi:hypothetical protein
MNSSLRIKELTWNDAKRGKKSANGDKRRREFGKKQGKIEQNFIKPAKISTSSRENLQATNQS